MSTTKKIFRPFLKWPGGKSKLVPEITKFFPKNPPSRFFEPFVGGGSVFLNSYAGSETECFLSDTNPDLINLFNFAKTNPENLIEECENIFGKHSGKEFYCECREEFNFSQDLFRKAALFIYLNRFCFNGICRYNSSGKFNVPYGGDRSPSVPKNEILHFSKVSQNAAFTINGFEEVMCDIGSGDVVYCDPPYMPISPTASFTKYSVNDFTKKDHLKLADLALICQSKGAICIISNSDTPGTRRIFEDASQVYRIPVRRSVSAKSASRGNINEIIAVYI